MGSYYRDPNISFHLDHERAGQLFNPNAPNVGTQHSQDPSSSGPVQGHGTTRYCSVRGCTSILPYDYGNKMCDICRGRHRIYASTKRAKRKMEKAALGMQSGWIPSEEGGQEGETSVPRQEVRSIRSWPRCIAVNIALDVPDAACFCSVRVCRRLLGKYDARSQIVPAKH